MVVRIGWFLTGLVTVAWAARTVAYSRETADLGFIFITFCAALAVIVVWIGILIASSITAGCRLRREMRNEQPTRRVDV